MHIALLLAGAAPNRGAYRPDVYGRRRDHVPLADDSQSLRRRIWKRVRQQRIAVCMRSCLCLLHRAPLNEHVRALECCHIDAVKRCEARTRPCLCARMYTTPGRQNALYSPVALCFLKSFLSESYY
jgi:hypothetical protein